MKRIISYITTAVLFLGIASCDRVSDNWNSAAYEYSGQFDIEWDAESGLRGADLNSDYQLLIYNTSSNLPNEIWIDHNLSYVKTKLFLDGNINSFTSRSNNYQELTDNEYWWDWVYGQLSAAPLTAADQEVEFPRYGYRVYLNEGKITPKEATTVGGNVSDGIYLNLTLLGAKAKFRSYQTERDTWDDPDVPEFDWAFVSVEPEPTLDDEFTFSGYRHTGLPEDTVHY